MKFACLLAHPVCLNLPKRYHGRLTKITEIHFFMAVCGHPKKKFSAQNVSARPGGPWSAERGAMIYKVMSEHGTLLEEKQVRAGQSANTIFILLFLYKQHK